MTWVTPNQWKRSKVLHIYLQHVGQGDGEKTQDIPPQDVFILEWNPDNG